MRGRARLLARAVAAGLAMTTAVTALLGCTKTEKTIRLGVNLELTGRLAWYGQATLSGIRLAVEEINASGGVSGRPVELVVLDNRSENAEAALAAIRLAERKGVTAIIGPSTSGGVKASLATESGVPIIVPSATADVLVPESAPRNEMIRLCYTDTMQGGAMARFAHKAGYRRCAMLIESSSDYARGMGDAFAELFRQLGGEIVAQEFYTGGETDFGGVIARLKAERFDALFVPAYYTEAALILRQLAEQGVTVPILSGDAFDAPALDELVGDSSVMSGIYYSNHYAPDDSTTSRFTERYYQVYKTAPPAYAALGYDSARLFAAALQQTEGKTRGELLALLAHTVDYEGVTGSITIDVNHNAQKAVHIIAIQNGVRQGVDVIAPTLLRLEQSATKRRARLYVSTSGEVLDAVA